MSQQKLSLYALSGVVRDEAFLDGQLQVAGSNQSRILENLQRNKNSVKRQAKMVKIIYACLIGVLSIMPVYMYFVVKGEGLTMDSLYFVSNLLITITSGMTFMYMLILGLISLSGFMSGDVFQWLEVLPIPQKDLQKVCFIVLWRYFDIPLIVQMVAFPVLMTVITGNVFVLLVCFATSFLNTLVIFCILVIIMEKFSRIIKGGSTNSTKATIVRTLTMLGYVIAMMSASLVLNLVFQQMTNIIDGASAISNPGLVNLFLSLIPFPFAPSYLVSLVLFPTGTIPLPLLGSTLIGIVLLVLMVWRLYRAVLHKLRNLTSHQARIGALAGGDRSSQKEMRPITPVSPVKAFFRKDIAALTRDLQGMVYMFMPLIFPFIMFLQAAGSGSGGSLDWTGGIVHLYAYLLIYLIMIAVMNSGMLVSGILGLEDSGASIMASLPVLPRDQAKAKMKIISFVNLISLLLPILILAGQPDIALLIPYFLCFCPVGMAIAFLTLAIKVRLFGKMRYKYVIEEVNVNRKAMKWLAIVSLDIVLLLGLFFLVLFMGESLTPMGILVTFAVSGAGGLVAVLWWLHRMFPKQYSRPVIEISH